MQDNVETILALVQKQAEEIERLDALLKWEQHRAGRIGTHSESCWRWGPQHYECALGEIDRMREVIETWHSLSIDKAQHRKTAEAIMQDILTRKGLGSAWKDWWDLTTEDTKIAVINAWVDIMINGDGEVSEPNEAA